MTKNSRATEGFDPARIQVTWNHIDGPLMRLPSGGLKWLSWRERFMHWIGRWSLEDIARRPDGFSKAVYYPPHDTWLSLRAHDAIATETRRAETTGSVEDEGAAIVQEDL